MTEQPAASRQVPSPPWTPTQQPSQHRPASLIVLQLVTIAHVVGAGCLLIAVTFVFTPRDSRSDDTPVLEPFVPVLPSLVVAVLILVLRALLPPIRPRVSVDSAGSGQHLSAGLLARQGRRRFLAEVLLENAAAALAALASLALCFLMRDVSRWQAQIAIGSVMVVLLLVVLPTRRRLRAAQRRYERAGARTGLNEQYR